MRRSVLGISIFAIAAAVLTPAAAVFIDKKMSRDVRLIVSKPDTVEINRLLWEKGQPVAEIYGSPSSDTIRVVRPDPRDLIVPEEDRSMTLMVANGTRHPLQVQTVYFFARFITVGAFLAGVLLMALSAILGKKPAAGIAS